MSFKKNTAVTGFPFGLISATDGSAVTTGTPVVYYVLDGGAQGTVAGTSTHEGNGQWSVPLTAGEMNGDVVGILVTNTGSIPVSFTIKTETKLVSDLNDVAATDIVSTGAITTSGGAVSTVSTVSGAVVLPTIPANWITAAGINAAAMNGKGDWNIGKTGYTLTQAFPTNFSALAITAGGLVDINVKTGFSISGTITTLDGLNNFNAATDTVGTVTTLTNLPAITAGWLTATGIAASALNGKGDWNIGKTGYTLTQTFPTNFSALAITAGGLVDINVKTGFSISGTITTLDGLNNFNAATDTVANVTTVATNTDMLTAAAVNAEVVDALNVDTYGEPTQGIPPETASIQYKTSFLYKTLINEKSATSSLIQIMNNAATIVDHKRTIADDTTTYTEDKIISGP